MGASFKANFAILSFVAGDTFGAILIALLEFNLFFNLELPLEADRGVLPAAASFNARLVRGLADLALGVDTLGLDFLGVDTLGLDTLDFLDSERGVLPAAASFNARLVRGLADIALGVDLDRGVLIALFNAFLVRGLIVGDLETASFNACLVRELRDPDLASKFAPIANPADRFIP